MTVLKIEAKKQARSKQELAWFEMGYKAGNAGLARTDYPKTAPKYSNGWYRMIRMWRDGYDFVCNPEVFKPDEYKPLTVADRLGTLIDHRTPIRLYSVYRPMIS